MINLNVTLFKYFVRGKIEIGTFKENMYNIEVEYLVKI